MIKMVGWEIIKRHDIWIYAQGINMGGPSNAGRCFQLVDTRGVMKMIWIESAT